MTSTCSKRKDLMRLSKANLTKECKKYNVSGKGSKVEIVERILLSKQDKNKSKLKKKKKKKKQLKKKKKQKKCRKMRKSNVASIHTVLLSYCRNIEKQMKLSSEIPKDVIFIIGYYYVGKQIIFGIGQNKKHLKLSWTRLNCLETLINDWHNIYVMGGAIVVKSWNNELFAKFANDGPYAGYIDFGVGDIEYVFDNIDSWTNIRLDENIPNINEIKVSIISQGICDNVCALLVTANNDLYAFGNNDSAMFGNGERGDIDRDENFELIDTKSWLNVSKHNTIIDIQCGSEHTLFLTLNGNVFMCGQNAYSHCIPNCDDAFIVTPTLMAQNIKMMAVGCSYSHSILLSNDNKIKSFGQETKKINSLSEYFNENNIEIINIKSGKDHGCLLSLCGKAYTFGNNEFGQIGNGKFDECVTAFSAPYYVNVCEQIVDIECGKFYTVLLSVTNSLYLFGDNRWHQCSAVLNNEKIAKPHHFDKIEELQFAYFIEKVIGLVSETILFVDPFRECSLIT